MENYWILVLCVSVLINFISFVFAAYKKPIWTLDKQIGWLGFITISILLTTVTMIYFWDEISQNNCRVLIVLVAIMSMGLSALSFLIVQENYEEHLRKNMIAFHLSKLQNGKLLGYLVMKNLQECPKARVLYFGKGLRREGYNHSAVLISATIWNGIICELK